MSQKSASSVRAEMSARLKRITDPVGSALSVGAMAKRQSDHAHPESGGWWVVSGGWWVIGGGLWVMGWWVVGGEEWVVGSE